MVVPGVLASLGTPTSSKQLIEAHSLTVQFGQEDPVIDGVTLAVRASEIVGLVGPNGGGKSTLLAALSRRVAPKSGSIQAPERLGLVLATPGFYPSLTILENLQFFAALEGPVGRQALMDLSNTLGIGDLLDRRADTLSSGQAQRAALVRALLSDPSVLLLDEPTANIDAHSAELLHERLRTEAEGGRTIILCTHDLEAARWVCDRVLVLKQRIVEELQTDGHRAAPGPIAASVMALESSGHSTPSMAPPAERSLPPTLRIAMREWKELARHPSTLLSVAILTFLVQGAFVVIVFTIENLTPEQLAQALPPGANAATTISQSSIFLMMCQ